MDHADRKAIENARAVTRRMLGDWYLLYELSHNTGDMNIVFDPSRQVVIHGDRLKMSFVVDNEWWNHMHPEIHIGYTTEVFFSGQYAHDCRPYYRTYNGILNFQSNAHEQEFSLRHISTVTLLSILGCDDLRLCDIKIWRSV